MKPDGTTYAVLDVVLGDDGTTTLRYDGTAQFDHIGDADAAGRARSESGVTCVVCKITPVSYFEKRNTIKN